MTTNTSENGLESLIVAAMQGHGWQAGSPDDYSRDFALDLVQFRAFLLATQPDVAAKLDLSDLAGDLNTHSPTRQKFLARLRDEIGKRGVIDVLRKGVKHGAVSLHLFYSTPSPDNPKAVAHFAQNRFTVSRQLRYNADGKKLALDLAIFINGLPVATFELKNSLTKQTYTNAIEQYKNDREAKELLFNFGRCMVHFAVDDDQVWMCTKLADKASWFLPFNRGHNDGAGNPPNLDGLKTAYLWEQVLTPRSLANIIENFAQIVDKKDQKTGKTEHNQVFPRYHQLDVVRCLLADVTAHGVGQRYLIQHSAGSGKSNSIAWLAHQLTGLRQATTAGEGTGASVFDSVIVVTDRRILDQQITDTIKGFAQVSAIVGHAEHSGDLRKFIQGGKKIIITTVQKFPYILHDIDNEQGSKHFAIIIDEAHSSQGGKATSAMSTALSDADVDAEEDTEDKINAIMAGRKMLTNASYFAFTATPKNKTLETFGTAYAEGDKVKHRPFHSYTMKQAIQEGFILDVLKNYTPVASYYKLVKTIEDDPQFDTKRAQKKLRQFVESHDHAVKLKAEVMVDHFHEQVIAKNLIGGQARAMVVTSSIERAIQYYHAVRAYLGKRKSPYQAIVAFSGEHEYGGVKVTEASLNGFGSGDIADRIQKDPYRFLICADKFQTGYDEPLLHTMYVDKPLAGVKAVQTLSRLNRAHPQKHDVFVLDFMNDAATIEASFAAYYRTTILSGETDPNKLHDLKADLDGYQVYSQDQIEALVGLYLAGAPRDQLDPILDTCVAVYSEMLDEDGQVGFKSKAKAFTRTYNFLASILDFSDAGWEKLSIFLTFLIPKLPAPVEEDLSRGILDAIDMDSYRVEKQVAMAIVLADENAEIDPVPTEAGGFKSEPELDQLSDILAEFNQLFGHLDWSDADHIKHLISEEIPRKVGEDKKFQNAKKNSDKQNARIEHDQALVRVMTSFISSDIDLYKKFSDDESFKRWLADRIFAITYEN